MSEEEEHNTNVNLVYYKQMSEMENNMTRI